MIKKDFKCYRCKSVLFREYNPNIINVKCSCGAVNLVKEMVGRPKSFHKGVYKK